MGLQPKENGQGPHDQHFWGQKKDSLLFVESLVFQSSRSLGPVVSSSVRKAATSLLH